MTVIVIAVIIATLYILNKRCPHFRVVELSEMEDNTIYTEFYIEERLGPFWIKKGLDAPFEYIKRKYDSKETAIKEMNKLIDCYSYGIKKKKYY